MREKYGVALILVLVGFLLVAQWRGADSAVADLESQSDEDLAVIIDELSVVNDSLREESARLESQVREARRDDEGREELLNQAIRELQGLRVLTGTQGAVGDGIELVIEDPQEVLLAQDLVAVVNELRAAGAEAIEIDGKRVTARTGFASTARGLTVDGERMVGTHRARAIGPADVLIDALEMPGGLVSTLEAFPGVRVTLVARQSLELPRAEDPAFVYAEPVLE
jgi:uncharacterized protein YlxW (UPF0749 family)